jgi:hypothetical protein
MDFKTVIGGWWQVVSKLLQPRMKQHRDPVGNYAAVGARILGVEYPTRSVEDAVQRTQAAY